MEWSFLTVKCLPSADGGFAFPVASCPLGVHTGVALEEGTPPFQASLKACLWSVKSFLFFFKILFYLFMRNIHREAETQAEGEAGSMLGARRGTRSRDSRMAPWAKGRRAKPLSNQGSPHVSNLFKLDFFFSFPLQILCF